MPTFLRPHAPARPRPTPAAALATGAVLLLASAAAGQSASPEPSAGAESGCWTSQPGVVGSVDHPTDPLAVVLRMSVGGGFVPVEVNFMEAPTFTLYGNDVVIFRPSGEPESLEEPLAPFACTSLSPDEVDELLTFALDEGGLRDARADYPNPNITDVPSTTFTIDADGVSKTVSVQALGFDEIPPPDPEARAQFIALRDVLAAFDARADAAVLYEVPLYRAMLSDLWQEDAGSAQAWPWTADPAELFGADLAEPATLTSEEVAQVVAVPSGGQTLIPLELPDGRLMNLTLRPLLPDEI